MTKLKRVESWLLHLVVGVVFMAIASPAAAAVPGTMAFAGRVTDANGPVQGSVGLTFRLFDSAVGGTQFWNETISTQAQDGLVTVELGLDAPLDETVFDGSELFLEVSVNGTALHPRSAVGTVPYAFSASHADDASSLGGMPSSSWQRRVTGSCPAGSSIRAIGANGTVSCESDDNATYAAGVGLQLTGSEIAVKAPTFHNVSAGNTVSVSNRLFCAVMSANEPAGCLAIPPPTPTSAWILSSHPGGTTCTWVCLPR